MAYPIVQVVNRFKSPKYVREVVRYHGTDCDKSLIFDTIRHTVAELTSGMTVYEVQITAFRELNEIVARRLNDTLPARIKQPIIPVESQAKHVEREKRSALPLQLLSMGRRTTTRRSAHR